MQSLLIFFAIIKIRSDQNYIYYIVINLSIKSNRVCSFNFMNDHLGRYVQKYEKKLELKPLLST